MVKAYTISKHICGECDREHSEPWLADKCCTDGIKTEEKTATKKLFNNVNSFSLEDVEQESL